MVYSKITIIRLIFIIQFRYNAHFDWFKKQGLFQKGSYLIYFYNIVQIQCAFWLVKKAWFIPKRRSFIYFWNSVLIQRALWLVETAWFIPKRRTFYLFLLYSSDITRTSVGWKIVVFFKKGKHFIYFHNTVQIQRVLWLVEKACMVCSKEANIWSTFIIQFRYNAHSDWLKKHGFWEYKTRTFSCHAICECHHAVVFKTRSEKCPVKKFNKAAKFF